MAKESIMPAQKGVDAPAQVTATIHEEEPAAPPPPVHASLPAQHQYVVHDTSAPPAMGAPVAMHPQLLVVQRRVVGQKLKPEGWCCVIALAFIFWPLMCVPCCLPQCMEDVVVEETVNVMPTQLGPPPMQGGFVSHPL